MFDINVDSVQRPRLSAHCETILTMLRAGTVSNVEIAKVSKNHTARISNLRKAGYVIKCRFIDKKTGLTEYTLLKQPETAVA